MKNVLFTTMILLACMIFISCGETEDDSIYGNYDGTYPDNDKQVPDDKKEDQEKPDEDMTGTVDEEPDVYDDSEYNDEYSDDEEYDPLKDMVLVPDGFAWVGCNEFVETDCPGDELPYYEIVTASYYIDKYEVTVEAFKKCIDDGACGEEGVYYNTVDAHEYCNLGTGKNKHPMNCVSYFGAVSFCQWAGKRLPSEAEWEKAARGGCDIHGEENCDEASYIYTWGNDGPPDCSKVNMADDDSDWGCGSDSTAAVGSFESGKSPYGSYDMLGNLYEWVADNWTDDHSGALQDGSPEGLADSYGVIKGGGFMQSDTQQFRVSYRAQQSTDEILFSRGFRCVMDAD